MLLNLLRDMRELVYPSTELTDPNISPIDFSAQSFHIAGHEIDFNMPPFCVRCSRHLENPTSNICLTCLKFNPNFDFALSACLYNKGLISLIHQFKYQDKTYLRHLFGQLLISFIEFYQFDLRQFDAVVAVPLFSSKHRERGFNQSELLAQKISAYYRIPLKSNNLKRIKWTGSQSQLNQKERWTNLHDAFKINRSIELKNKNILIIDDVLTTGATVSALANALKNIGANTVGVLTLATTP